MCSLPPESVFRFNKKSDWSHLQNYSALKFLGANYDKFPGECGPVSDVARANENVAIELIRGYGLSFDEGDELFDVLREIVMEVQVSFSFHF